VAGEEPREGGWGRGHEHCEGVCAGHEHLMEGAEARERTRGGVKHLRVRLQPPPRLRRHHGGGGRGLAGRPSGSGRPSGGRRRGERRRGGRGLDGRRGGGERRGATARADGRRRVVGRRRGVCSGGICSGGLCGGVGVGVVSASGGRRRCGGGAIGSRRRGRLQQRRQRRRRRRRRQALAPMRKRLRIPWEVEVGGTQRCATCAEAPEGRAREKRAGQGSLRGV